MDRSVDFKPTCGNILSGVGPAAIEMGLVRAEAPATRVRIRAVNTGALVDAVIQTPDRRVTYGGDLAIDGVPGRAAPIRLRWTCRPPPNRSRSRTTALIRLSSAAASMARTTSRA